MQKNTLSASIFLSKNSQNSVLIDNMIVLPPSVFNLKSLKIPLGAFPPTQAYHVKCHLVVICRVMTQLLETLVL